MDRIASSSAGPSPGLKRNPLHRITVEPFDGVVTVRFSSAVLASSRNVKVLKESGHPEVLYIPFEDVYFDMLHRSQTSTHCPFKGDASYWSVTAAGEAKPDVMWAYEHPYEEMLSIRNHGAFYPDKVAIEAVRQGETDRPIA
ncbi:MAG: DUF427 domain-containing protein [Mesorhizobium sp.]|nr:DUF427 domain-containing protein [Mesorhizobium sp.]MBN9244824.1 DUF427 domain-containing protein [Mesorhizobium sp.]